MGFASGFRTGLAAGGAERSNMPIVQSLGQMIQGYRERAKKPAISLGRGGFGPSSYDKYVARKAAEEAAAEEKRRYDEEMKMQREKMATQQQAAQVQEQRTQEAHESQMASQAQQREQAAAMFERSKKKEDRIEAYRALLQGVAAGNKALVEQSWAALSPDMEEKDAKTWAPIKDEMVQDPETGEQYRKFTVGRDPKTGQESDKALPAPSINFNQDGTITAEFPSPSGKSQSITYQDADDFMKRSPVAFMNPEFESSKSLADKGKKERQAEEDKRKQRKEQRDIAKYDLGIINDQIKEVQTQIENAEIDPDRGEAMLKDLRKEKNSIIARAKKGGRPQEKTAVAKAGGAGKKGEPWQQHPRTRTLGFAGEEAPEGEPDARRGKDGFWYRPDPDNPGQWQLITKPDTTIAAH